MNHETEGQGPHKGPLKSVGKNAKRNRNDTYSAKRRKQCSQGKSFRGPVLVPDAF